MAVLGWVMEVPDVSRFRSDLVERRETPVLATLWDLQGERLHLTTLSDSSLEEDALATLEW
jgi:hypothetical protein